MQKRCKNQDYLNMITVCLLLVAGIVVTQLPDSAFPARTPNKPSTPGSPATVQPKSILKKTADLASVGEGNPSFSQTLAPSQATSTSPSSLPSSNVTWSDDDSPDNALERVVEFEDSDSPQAVAVGKKKARRQKAHKPKPVPAIPRRRQLPEGTVPGYAPSYNTNFPPVEEEFNTPVPGPSAGPVFYKPPYKYRTVNQISEERKCLENIFLTH